MIPTNLQNYTNYVQNQSNGQSIIILESYSLQMDQWQKKKTNKQIYGKNKSFVVYPSVEIIK